MIPKNLGIGKRGQSVVGVDIGSSSIKVVQLRKERGVAILETYGELALGPYAGLEIGQATNLSADKISEALKDLLTEANVTTKDAAVSIPFSSSLISLVELPKRSESELAKMIPIEARKYIPVPISEVQLDWFIIPDDDAKYFSDEGDEKKDISKKASVLLVAIHKEMLNKFRDVFQKTELKPTFFEIEIFSAVRSIVERGANPVAILDIGAASTKLYVVEYGIVKVSHTINKGSQDITLALSKSGNMGFAQAEEAKRAYGLAAETTDTEEQYTKQSSLLTIDHIFSETHRMILNYQKRYNRSVATVVLTGGGSAIKGVLGVAKTHLEMNVEVSDPFQKVQAPAFLEAILKEAGPTFTIAVGLALRKLQETE